MVTSRKSMRWILLGAATVIVLAGAGITAWIWQANYRAWHNPRVTPLFGQIEPADGATVYESDLWISWSSPEANRARVLWRKRGDLRVRDADAGSGQELLAHLAPVTAGAKYEYIVEETRGDQTLRSSVRTLNVKSGLAFEPVVEQTIERDYDQTVKLTLRNRSSQPIVVSAKALKRFADLPADITGYGSVEVPAQLAPNSTLDLRLAVTADDATRGSYEIPVEAAGAYVTARFNVHIPKLSLSFSIAEEDPQTLTKTIYIHNKGDTLSDFTVRVVPANQQDLELQPAVNHALLHADSGVYLRVAPILYLEFQSLKAEIEASAAGHTAHFPLEFQAPPGVRLIAFRSASTWFSFAFGRICTNHPNTCSIMPAKGNGPTSAPIPTAFAVTDKAQQRTDEMVMESDYGEQALKAGTSACANCGEYWTEMQRLVDLDTSLHDAFNRIDSTLTRYRSGQLPGADRYKIYAAENVAEEIKQSVLQLDRERVRLSDIWWYYGCDSSTFGPKPIIFPSPEHYSGPAKDFFGGQAKKWRDRATDDRDWATLIDLPVYKQEKTWAAREEDRTADMYESLQRDPPSSEFKDVVNVRFEAPPTDRDLPGHEPAIAALIGALRAERAYLDAWLRSYERYQGAQAANDGQAMGLQAKAMVEFSKLALQAGQQASHARYNVDIKDDTLLDNIRSSRNATSALESERGARLSAKLKARLEIVDVLRRRPVPIMLSPLWPEQPDTVALVSLQQFASELLRQANSAYQLASRGMAPLPAVRPVLRAGFLQSLRRQAGFTRSHRGWFAAPVDLSVTNSSAPAASFYTDAHVYFAWHQQSDQIVFAAFDPAGKVTLEPHVIGKGRWPRMAADGQRVAVAWSSADGSSFTVRMNDGKQWGNEHQLPGRDAALGFAAGGPLYAVTSAGLWKSNGNSFDRTREFNYQQAAIAVDRDGQPHIAWRKNGRIVYNGSDVGEGERPSIIIAPDGTVNVAYVSTGSLVMRSARAGQWSDPDTIPAKNPSWPTLALDSNGAVRLSYVGAADYGPDALWLVRLPDKSPIMMPSLEGNVTDAWLAVQFSLEDTRNNYRPHDVLLTVNDVWVKMFQNNVPDGRYLFRLNPHQIFTSSGQPVPNRVAIQSWHMNPGHYATSSNYELIVRTAWSEHYAFAAAEEEARRGVGTYLVNHDQPDLGIFANATDLPVEIPKPGRMDIPVMVANVGEATSSPVRLLMLGEKNEVLAARQVPALNPGAEKTVRMPLDYDGKLAQVTFRLEENRDFNLRLWAWGLRSNDSLTLTLWGPKPTGYVGPEPGLPKVPLELKVAILNGPELAARYRIVDAFSKRMIAKVVSGDQFGPLRSGTYRVAVQSYPDEGKEILFTDTIEHEAGVPQAVQLNSGISIDLPAAAGSISQWSVVEAGNPGRVVQWQNGRHPLMALPPGDYQLAILPMEQYSQRLVWPDKVRVQPGQHTTVKLDSAVLLEMPKDAPLARWELVRFGKPDQVIQWQLHSFRTMVIPPGDYQVATLPLEQYSQRLVWPEKIRVQPGQQSTVKLDSAVLLDMPKDAPLARWELVRFGKPDEVIQWQLHSFRTMVIPPGDYQVATLPLEQYSQRLVWPEKVRVQPGQQARARLDSGVRLEMPKDASLARWQLVRFGKPEEVIQWQLGSFRTMVVPPGEYQLDVKADESGPWKTVADSVAVRQGHATEVRVPEIPK